MTAALRGCIPVFSTANSFFLDMALIVKHDYQTTFEKIDCRMRGIYGLGSKQW